jgi:hypothetical protein
VNQTMLRNNIDAIALTAPEYRPHLDHVLSHPVLFSEPTLDPNRIEQISFSAKLASRKYFLVSSITPSGHTTFSDSGH